MRSKPLAIGVIGVVIGVLLSTAVVLAGNPSPPAGPGEPGSQMFTLQTIYDRLAYGAAGSTAPAFTEPSAAPGGTMHTLGDIMDAAPAPDAANGATAAHVAAGKTFWGLTAEEWGLQTGTASGGDTTYLAGVPKSGQTTLYATGDDGDLEKGVALPNGQGGGTVPPAPNPPTCFATADGGVTTLFASVDAHAVQQAVDAAGAGGVVKVAGTCVGVENLAGTWQSVHIPKTLTLSGGYTTTNWTTSNAVANPTTIDAAGGGRVIFATLALTVSDLTLQHGYSIDNGGGIYADGMRWR
jgi:threonine dehydrogenase-like Zn-dependent dehydrogenase